MAPSQSCRSLRTSTSSSAGVDLATSGETIIQDTSVVLIPTGIYGPLGYGKAALLIGCCSTKIRGLFVLPGVIDADFEGETKIMVWTSVPPCTIPGGSRIAQLIYFSPQSLGAIHTVQGSECFGSTGMPEIYWTQQLTVD
ncbi:deoxyuridine 5'-triphosphate nucleotidohydrolase-like [Melopsittacus undulatus]|uniref:deoxyuridine 5'-triphosphate nucleotidohydrolase-like n=1 Tax=Melopsittacus undulatus TaxID=13146 RepID=UPI00146EAED8|nr:deoxyuridine 5'-triphosphate nucleotidohydrolase-like [Melopsittacus undulatus]